MIVIGFGLQLAHALRRAAANLPPARENAKGNVMHGSAVRRVVVGAA
jgi:hypothetical protein